MCALFLFHLLSTHMLRGIFHCLESCYLFQPLHLPLTYLQYSAFHSTFISYRSFTYLLSLSMHSSVWFCLFVFLSKRAKLALHGSFQIFTELKIYPIHQSNRTTSARSFHHFCQIIPRCSLVCYMHAIRTQLNVKHLKQKLFFMFVYCLSVLCLELVMW